MKPKLKLEMKEKLFVVSIMIYIASLVLLMGLSPGVFTGIWWIGVFANSQAFSVVSTLIVGLIMILFTYLARKVSINFIYIVRGVLLLLAILNAISIGWEPISCSIYFIATVALLIMSFIKENEVVIANDLTQEELANIEKENKREMEREIVGSLLGFFLVPIIVVILLVGASAPIVEADFEELKNRYRVDLPSEMASEELSKEIIESIENEDGKYISLENLWYVNEDKISKMLVSQYNSDDYWLVNDNPHIIYHLYYDDWDNVADEHIYISSEFEYPNPATSKVSKIEFGNDENDPDLTQEEIELLQFYLFGSSSDKAMTVEDFEDTYFDVNDKVRLSWCFEDEEALWYNNGLIIRTTDGKCYLLKSASTLMLSYYDEVYLLPTEICKKLENVW